jgi:CRP-like cAMP-binding protein
MNSTSEVTNDLYAGFSEQVRRELTKHEQTVTVPRGTRLLQCGTSPDQLIILNSGSAETSVSVAGKNMSLGIARPGKVFGLHSVIAGAPPDTSVTCLEECEVTFLPKTVFLNLLQRNPQMYFAVVKVLSSDLVAADRVIRHYGRGSTAKASPNCFKPE